MAIVFTVEDGTGLAAATSYLSIEDMEQLWDNAGYDHSALTDDQIKVLLNNATLSLDGQYGGRWPGTRGDTTQALDWPRSGVVDQDGFDRSSTTVPPEIENAVSEIAFADNAGTDINPTSTETGALRSESVAVEGAVKESKSYFEGTSQTYPTLPKVENALRRLLGPSGAYGAMNVVRA